MTETQNPLLERFSKEEKIVAGCAIGTMVLCALPWWSFSHPMGSANIKAFDTTWGVLAFLGALGTAGVVVGVKMDFFKLKPDLAVRIPLLTAGLATLFVFIFIVSGPSGDYGQASEIMSGIDAGNTLWCWVALLAMGASTYFAYQRFASSARSVE